MRKIIAFLILPCMIFLVGCSGNTDKAAKKTNDTGNKKVEENIQTPPELQVMAGDSAQKAILQKYDWTYTESNNNEKNEIKTLMDEQDVVKTAPSITVSSANKLSFKFGSEPKSYTVRMILPNEAKLEVVNSEVSIPIPSSLGQATFKVEGKWDQGTAIYMFNLDIQG
ncbi:MAG: hypothetical protein ACRC7N_05910 [Clostridium sp.]